jgi:hypothetical protein
MACYLMTCQYLANIGKERNTSRGLKDFLRLTNFEEIEEEAVLKTHFMGFLVNSCEKKEYYIGEYTKWRHMKYSLRSTSLERITLKSLIRFRNW